MDEFSGSVLNYACSVPFCFLNKVSVESLIPVTLTKYKILAGLNIIKIIKK